MVAVPTKGPIVVIADDLTGAAELAGRAVACGITSQVVLLSRGCEVPVLQSASDVVCVDTDSRGLSPEDAMVQVRIAATFALELSPRFIFKKVDSVLRGPVLFEIRELMQVFGFPQCLLVPCNPTLGRTIVGGRYLINGKPISFTQFRHDPEYPRLNDKVTELMECPPGLRLALTSRMKWPIADVIIGEAQDIDDVLFWARKVRKEVLPAGGSDFFSACLVMHGGLSAEAVFGVDGCLEHAEAKTVSRELFVCGSASKTTVDFIAEQARRGVRVIGLPREALENDPMQDRVQQVSEKICNALEDVPRVILSVGLPLVSDRVVGARLSSWLSMVTVDVLHRTRIKRVYAEGGATAVALARQAGWHRLRVVGELARGVVMCQTGGETGVEYVIKPGSYPWPAWVREAPIQHET